MPNHVHVLLYFEQMLKPLNTTVGNAKRFMAYEIIKRLEEGKQNNLLDLLHHGVKKGKQAKDSAIKFLKTALTLKNAIVKSLFSKA
jgi:RNase P/RNase MRP subunit POP5